MPALSPIGIRKYQWREGSRLKGDPQKIGEQLEALAIRLGRDKYMEISKAEFVAEAKANPDSPMGEIFDFDAIEEAANSHWESVALSVMRCLRLRIIHEGGTRTYIGRIHIIRNDDDDKPQHYMAMTDLVVSDDEIFNMALEENIAQLHGWERRINELTNFEADISPLVEEMIARIRRLIRKIRRRDNGNGKERGGERPRPRA